MVNKKRKVKRGSVKRVSSVRSRRSSRTVSTRASKRKFGIVVKNLILFVFLSVLSAILSAFIPNEFVSNLFRIFEMVFLIVSLAFIIILVVLFFLRLMKK